MGLDTCDVVWCGVVQCGVMCKEIKRGGCMNG